MWDFTLNNQPSSYVYYFGFSTQRINSFATTPQNQSILSEEVFLTVIGALNAKTTYPDAGSGNVSSEGVAEYPTFTATGILRHVKRVRIQFFEDLSRQVTLLGC